MITVEVARLDAFVEVVVAGGCVACVLQPPSTSLPGVCACGEFVWRACEEDPVEAVARPTAGQVLLVPSEGAPPIGVERDFGLAGVPVCVEIE